MRKFLILPLLIFLAGCWPGERYTCKGLPDVNQSFVFFHFINEREAYLVGTLTHFEEMSKAELNNPTSSPDYIEEGTVYKTIDGGISWTKVHSQMGCRYRDAVLDNRAGYLYIIPSNLKFSYNNIIRLDLSDFKETTSDTFATISDLWMNGTNINFTTNRGKKFLYTLNQTLSTIDSTPVAEYFIKGITTDEHHYALIATSEKHLLCEMGNDDLLREVPLSLNPWDFEALNDSILVIAGENKSEIDIALYNTSTGTSNTVKTFEGYTLATDIHAKRDVITAFVGNIGSYDLCYSLDAGKTWKLQKNINYFSPSALLGKTLYIYQGAASINKINLEDL